MKVTCKIGDITAFIDDGTWKSANAIVRDILNGMMNDFAAQYGPEHGDPDYAAARYCMEQIGGVIIEYETPPDDGKVY